MEIFAYIAAVAMGVLLGLLGGGGSVLTLPILVYLVGLPSTIATTYSMFVVGASAFLASLNYIWRKQVSWRSVIVFGLPSIGAIYFSRKIVFPALPQQVNIFGSQMQKDTLLMMIFSVFLLLAAWSMLRRTKEESAPAPGAPQDYRYLLLMLEGLAVGMIVGLLGAGGGFLIIPALVILAHLPMKKAIGTSLTLIFINSAIGFLGDLQSKMIIDWKLLATFTGFAFAGILIGAYLSKKIAGERLRPVFGWFILAMGLFIIAEELIIKPATE